jgi:hypothetical protein
MTERELLVARGLLRPASDGQRPTDEPERRDVPRLELDARAKKAAEARIALGGRDVEFERQREGDRPRPTR